MATTTTNYGFDIPQSTDLVKDGATAIATLGQDIDTAMNTALGTKKAGMVLLNTTSFSAVSSISIPANTFSATYRNYRVVFSSDSSQAGHIQIRWRAAGSDNTTSNYYSGYWYTNIASGATGTDVAGAASNIMSKMGYSNAAGVLTMFYDVFNPFETKATGISALQSRNDAVINSVGGYFQATTSFDSMTFIPSAGTTTGSVSVYGYNQ